MPTYNLKINGHPTTLDSWDPAQPLLYVLRNELGLRGVKFGCGLSQCGACTVLVDGVASRSCAIPVSALEGKTITTIHGLGSPDKPHPLQAAWIEEQVNQCGYCINGWLMEGAALLSKTPKPTEAQIRQTFASLICRCGTHNAALRAVQRASGQI